YALRAFELSAIDYLVKPIHRNRLVEAVKKLEEKIRARQTAHDYEVLLESIKNRQFRKIVIPEVGQKRVVEIADIVAIQANGTYSALHFVSDKKLTTSKGLNHFEKVLCELPNFHRSHKSWIINLRHVASYNKSSRIIMMSNGLETKLSKFQVKTFDQLLSNSNTV
ncbi:MAG: LytTR family DNA-binding domain-containing protein, partial [Bacteroidota bacterium]